MSKWYLALVICNAAVYAIVMILCGLATGPLKKMGLFRYSISVFTQPHYYTDISPAKWTFSMWGFVYVWQGVWVIYSLVSICRKSPDGPVYMNPILQSRLFYLIFMISFTFNFGWLLLWDRNLVSGALAILILLLVSVLVCLVLSYKRLNKYIPLLVKQRRTKEIWLVRFLVQNGLAFYAAWVSMGMVLNLNIVMIQKSNPSIESNVASSATLGILAFEILLYVATDILLLDRFARYTFSPYIIFVLGPLGILLKHGDLQRVSSIFTAALFGLSCACAIVKGVILLVQHRRYPLPSMVDEEFEDKRPIL